MAFQAIRDTYVANPSRVSHGNDKLDAPPDGLTSDDIPAPGSTSTSSRFDVLPNNPPKEQSIHAEIPQRSIPQSISGSPNNFSTQTENEPTPQESRSHHAGPSQHLFPQPVPPLFFNDPNASRVQTQALHRRTSQPPQLLSGHIPRFLNAPTRSPFDTLVSSNPFQASYDDEQVDAPPPFDDILIPEHRSMQGIATSPHGALSRPPNGDFPNTASPAGADGWSHNSTQLVYSTLNSQSRYQRPQPRAHPFSNVSGTQIQNRQLPAIPPPREYDVFEHRRRSLSREVYEQLKPPTPASSPSVQSQAPVLPVPSIQCPPTVRLNADAAQYPSYPPYPPDSQHSQYPDLRTPSLFNRQFFMPMPQPSTQSLTVTYGPSMDSDIHWHKVALTFFCVTFPEQMYLNCLLRLPSLYVSRVARIVEETNMSLPEMKNMALKTASQGQTHEYEIQTAFESASGAPAYKRLISTWESFIDSLMREWNVLNIISVLLLSASLTILQIEDAAEDPLTRYAALFSLICSLVSLLFGCVYILRFGGMRRAYKAAEWAQEAQKTKLFIWWNVCILLAMPANWLTWSIIFYIICIMSFVWRSGVASTVPSGLSEDSLLALRISITILLGIGLVYGILILATFQRYGARMDMASKQRIDEWIQELRATGNTKPPSHGSYPGQSAMYQLQYNHCPASVDDADSRYPHSPAKPPQTIVPSPDQSHMDWPHRSSNSLSRVNELTTNSSNLQDRDGTSPAAYIPNLRVTPSLRPRRSKDTSISTLRP